MKLCIKYCFKKLLEEKSPTLELHVGNALIGEKLNVFLQVSHI